MRYHANKKGCAYYYVLKVLLQWWARFLTKLMFSPSCIQEHCHSHVDNHTRTGYYTECWNGVPSHITADLILPLRWTDGPLDGGLYSTQLEVQVQGCVILNHGVCFYLPYLPQ